MHRSDSRAYTLSYIAPSLDADSKLPPRIQISISRRDSDLFDRLLARILDEIAEDTTFFSKRRLCKEGRALRFERGSLFGFSGVAQEVREEDEHRFVFPLLTRRADKLGATVEVMLSVLEMVHFSGENSQSNRRQLLTINMSYIGGPKPYPMWGQISADLMLWLKKRYMSLVKSPDDFWSSVKRDVEVTKVMRESFLALAPRNMRHLMGGCAMSISEDGRPQVSTFGGLACVTPDGASFWEPEHGIPSKLSSDNMDCPLQQLVNLAGLAFVHDLAKKEIDTE